MRSMFSTAPTAMRARIERVAGIFGVALLAMATVCAGVALAKDPYNTTRADFNKWQAKYAKAKPEFKPGDVLTPKDLDRIRPFMIPGYVDRFNFPGMHMKIIATRDHTPRKDYLNCTEKYQGQVRLNHDGTLANYFCGQPFPDSSLIPSDPMAGYRAVWNFKARWWNYGPIITSVLFVYDRFGGSHTGQIPNVIEDPPPEWMNGLKYQSKLPTNAASFFGGGGTFIKTALMLYERVYFSHLAPLASKGGVLPIPDAKKIYYKEFSGFYSPFDMRGQVFITYRYTDPHRADDAWAYDPQSRRVRRVSVEVKQDSVGGSDQTNEDFYTFSDRIVHWNFRFLGWKDLLCVMDGDRSNGHLYGPDGDLPDDVWSVRRFAVVERTPKVKGHPYSSVVMLWDAQNWHPWMAAIFDRQHRLYKTIVYSSRWTEDYKNWAEFNRGVHSTQVQDIIATDYRKKRATIFADFGAGYPNVSIRQVKSLFDVSKLEQFHQ